MSKLVIFFFLIIFISLILSLIMICIHIDYFYLEELYVKAITKFWYDNYPIVNVSLNKENDNYEKIEKTHFVIVLMLKTIKIHFQEIKKYALVLN